MSAALVAEMRAKIDEMPFYRAVDLLESADAAVKLLVLVDGKRDIAEVAARLSKQVGLPDEYLEARCDTLIKDGSLKVFVEDESQLNANRVSLHDIASYTICQIIVVEPICFVRVKD